MVVNVVVAAAAAIAPGMLADASAAVSTTSAVNTTDSCQMLLKLSQLCLWLSTLLCLCWSVMCAAMHGVVVSMLLERPSIAVIRHAAHSVTGDIARGFWNQGQGPPKRKASGSGYSNCPSRQQQLKVSY